MAQRGRPKKDEVRTKKPTQRTHPLIAAFGESYWVLPNNGGYCLYDTKRECKRANAQYVGKFYLSNNGERYVFNDDFIETVPELIETMDKYNATLPFSPEIYDPTYRKNYQIEMAVNDYLTSLGFKKISYRGVYGHIYELHDAYNQKVCAVEIETVEDTTKGCMRRWVFQTADANRIIEVPFSDLDSAIGACNSLLSSYCSMLNIQLLNMFNTMTDARASIMLDNTFDMKKASVTTLDARQQTIEFLEKELKRLKGED